MVVRARKQRAADDARRFSPLLAVAALRQGRPVVEAVDLGEEVGGVEQLPAAVEPEPRCQAQDDAAVPAGQRLLRAGREAPVECGDEDVGADGDALAGAFGHVPVDQRRERQPVDEIEQGRAGTEFMHGGLAGRGRLVFGGDEVVGGAEVLLPDDFGLPLTRFDFRA